MKGIILVGGSDAPVSSASCVVQAASTGLQQADDLLSIDGAHAGRNSRHPDHYHAARSTGLAAISSATARGWVSRSPMQRRQNHAASLMHSSLESRSLAPGRFADPQRQPFYGQQRIAERWPPSKASRERRSFAHQVADPERYGVVQPDNGRPTHHREGIRPKSNFAVTGLYFCDNQWSTSTRTLKPSPTAKSRSQTSINTT